MSDRFGQLVVRQVWDSLLSNRFGPGAVGDNEGFSGRFIGLMALAAMRFWLIGPGAIGDNEGLRPADKLFTVERIGGFLAPKRCEPATH